MLGTHSIRHVFPPGKLLEIQVWRGQISEDPDVNRDIKIHSFLSIDGHTSWPRTGIMARISLAKALWLSLGLASIAVPVTATIVTNDTAVAADQTYDYVIVGAGLTGLTVGNKVRSPQISTET